MNVSMTALAVYAGEKVLGALLIMVAILFVIALCSLDWIVWFRKELKYINTEIERNTGREQARWKRRRALW